jgi:tetratricopeptide (TPR) repeat protein
MQTGRWAALLLVVTALPACFLRGTRSEPKEVHFEPLQIVGDLDLEKLNAEELFAAGSSFFAAGDFKQAARYFGRIADFHPDSKHRREALYNAGLSHERQEEWADASMRFSELADPAKGTGDSLDAAFRVAETLYHLERYDDAVKTLAIIAGRQDLSVNKRIEAQVQQGICELEGGHRDAAEKILRRALTTYQDLTDKDEVDDYFPAQAQFFLGEIFRLNYEDVSLDADKSVDQLSKDLEYKSELLLSAQGHYLRAIRMGNGYWATAAGAQIGFLYENLYGHMIGAPAPKELTPEEVEIYRQELRKKIRVLLTKAINIYERTLEAAERIGAQNPFVERTRESLQKMKDLLIAEAQRDDDSTGPLPVEKADPPPKPPAKPGSLEPHS